MIIQERNKRQLFTDEMLHLTIMAKKTTCLELDFDFRKSDDYKKTQFAVGDDDGKLIQKLRYQMFPEIGDGVNEEELYSRYLNSQRMSGVASEIIPKRMSIGPIITRTNQQKLRDARVLHGQRLEDELEGKLFAAKKHELGVILRNYDVKYKKQVFARTQLMKDLISSMLLVRMVERFKLLFDELKRRLEIRWMASLFALRAFGRCRRRLEKIHPQCTTRILLDVRQ